MSDLPNPKEASRAIWELSRGQMKHQTVDPQPLSPLKKFLRNWQVARLAATHADLLASPEYGSAARFFLTDIYAAKDFSRRDADMQEFYAFLKRILPSQAVNVLAQAVEINNLTNALDDALLEAVTHQLGIENQFTQEQYEAAYRRCDNYDDREHQIDLIVDIGYHIDRLHRIPLVGTTLRLAGPPARRLGWGELHDFLERGYEAWKPIRNVRPFLEKIETREKTILDRIYEHDA